MWGKKDQVKMASANSDTTTLIADGTEIHGDIRFRGVMHVEGKIEGDIWATEGTFRLVDGGVVEGDIKAPHVIINGTVKGDVYATEKLELASQAVITGNVYYNLIEMVMGAQVNGSLEHCSVVQEEPKAIAAPSREASREQSREKVVEAEEAVVAD
ncbi:bactofilin family protein [Parendozoicomonas haliclonae]|uniref:Polymer-forming cytoskeletal n=1 Tax=Parendozoicomonas haliclonae TaxID=1960125 RepID=A0A1X7APK5_9GAMM|nr:polymer-forming cytoskeletal protein [Parendozoicomonas haliclonae]SMA50019.1 Polymer-forming cytoskeletal [Parendozoicomonas haliclonae]